MKQYILLKTAGIRTQSLGPSVYEALRSVIVNDRTKLGTQPKGELPIPGHTHAEFLKNNPAGNGVIIKDFTRLISATKMGGIKK